MYHASHRFVHSFIVLLTMFNTIRCEVYTIGLITSRTSSQTYAAATLLGIDKLYSEHINCTLRIVWRVAYSTPEGAGYAVDLFVDEKVDVIIGSPLSTVNTPIGHLTSFWNLPHISWLASDPKFAKKINFRTLIRTFGSLSKIGKAMVALFQLYDWKRTGIMTRSTGSCSYATDGLMNSFRNSGIHIAQKIELVTSTVSDSELDGFLIQLDSSARIFIICYGDMRRLIIRACKLGMCNGEHLFIYPNRIAKDDIKRPWYNNDTDDVIARKGYYYYFNINIARWSSKEKRKNLHTFREEVLYRMAEPPFNSTYALDNNLTASRYSPYLYDATYLYGLWLNYSITNNIDVHDGEAMFRFTHNLTFDGMTGPVVFDGNGDIEPQYWIWDVTDDSGYPRIIALIDNLGAHDIHFWEDPRWYTLDKKPPRDSPICGFFGEICPEDTSSRDVSIIAVGSGLLVLILLASILAYFSRKKQLEGELAKMMWKIEYDHIETVNGRRVMSTLKSLGSITMTSTALMSDFGDHAFTTVGRYMGQIVAVKSINLQSIALSRDDHLELKELREMTHENIAIFVGACVDPPNACILYQYCSKGSLQDILENEDIKLDWLFQFSLISDMTNGMVYIHGTNLKSHGRLKSSNCVISNRWVLKITDYGLHRLYKDCLSSKRNDDAEKYNSLLWTAPEHLRSPQCPKNGTQEGDVYSYGIILHEIFYRMGAFAEQKYTLKDIIERIKAENGQPFRPQQIQNVTIPEDFLSLMEMCWTEEPSQRMTFSQIKAYIRRHNKSKEGNIMDIMLKKLEKYACNLEELVEQRTFELMAEKKKTDQLLYRLLPSSVAEKLKCGKKVMPEVFDNVTIFFSDIVGFTFIASLSTPIQVIDLLNDLYTLFDAIIERHRVYKVETIGDAYMVVSGLPRRNGDAHAGEIANMALDLLSSLLGFRLRHLPEKSVWIRAGIHSGSCCAGIVGLTMPRYCLFGDTVNTASRMESNGSAQRIHVSAQAKSTLEKLGGYHLILRGEIQIKGKGLMQTYWLQGRNGFDKPLPDPPDLD